MSWIGKIGWLRHNDTGKTYQEIQSDEKLAFGGKVLFLFPPDPKPVAEPSAPPAKEPTPEPPKEKE